MPYWASLVAQLVRIPLECRRPRFHPWVGRSSGGGHGNPPQYACLETPMDREAWWATILVVTMSQAGPSVWAQQSTILCSWIFPNSQPTFYTLLFHRYLLGDGRWAENVGTEYFESGWLWGLRMMRMEEERFSFPVAAVTNYHKFSGFKPPILLYSY